MDLRDRQGVVRASASPARTSVAEGLDTNSTGRQTFCTQCGRGVRRVERIARFTGSAAQ